MESEESMGTDSWLSKAEPSNLAAINYTGLLKFKLIQIKHN